MPDLDKLDPGMNPDFSTGYKPDQMHVNSNPMRLFRFLLPATLSVGLSGCLFDRVLDVLATYGTGAIISYGVKYESQQPLVFVLGDPETGRRYLERAAGLRSERHTGLASLLDEG